MEKNKVFSSWYWSKASAEKAADDLRREGYTATARLALACDGRTDWLVEAFDLDAARAA